MLINITAFLMGFGQQIYLVAMPFIVKAMGGSDSQVGFCLAAGFLSYLFSCLLTARTLDGFNPKRLVQLGSVGIAFATAFVLVPILFASAALSLRVNMVILAAIIAGFSQSFFWPPLMGWCSIGHEGSQLRKKLGLYNAAWSIGMVAGPYLSGVLVEIALLWPVLAATAAMAASFVTVSLMKSPVKLNQDSADCCSGSTPQPEQDSRLVCFRAMARLALPTAYICLAISKTQLPILFKFELSLSESDFGLATTVLALANAAVFLISARLHRWHYKFSYFLIAQLMLVASMIMILNSSSLLLLCVAGGLIGIGSAFVYSSNQFYGVSGGKKRSGLMAVHEMLLASGHIIGGFTCGILSDNLGRYSPYHFGLVVIIVALIGQYVIKFVYSKRQK